MYSLYIPKYESDPSSALLLPKELAYFMWGTGYAYDLLVSSGYRKTVEDAMKMIASPAKRKKLGIQEPKEEIDVGFVCATPGSHAVPFVREMKVEGVVEEKDSHRQRVIFFLEKERKPIPPVLKSATKKAFLKKRTVKAVLFGVEYATCIDKEKEGDLLLFSDKEYGDIADIQITLDNFPEFRDMILGEVTVDLEAPEEYFKKMLKHFLDKSL